jgi:gentisate 1,2-dioxygenase
VYYVLEGSGFSVVDGCRFDWGPGDFFMLPPWMWHEHANPGGKDAIFFVINDRPIYDQLRLLREEALPAGRQEVTRQFKPQTRKAN